MVKAICLTLGILKESRREKLSSQSIARYQFAMGVAEEDDMRRCYGGASGARIASGWSSMTHPVSPSCRPLATSSQVQTYGQ